MNKKKILIKVTSSLGKFSSSSAEIHTLVYFVKWLSSDYDIIISGSESSLDFFKFPKNCVISKPAISYLSCKIAPIFHIPIAIINTIIDGYRYSPNLYTCLGGVYYNGLAVRLASVLFQSKCVIRTAEDHYEVGIQIIKQNFNFKNFIVFLNSILSIIVLSSWVDVLTVGEASFLIFKTKYKILKSRLIAIPGPINYEFFEKCNYNFFHKNRLLSKETSRLRKKIIFISNGSDYKGTNEFLKLANYANTEKINCDFYWITDQKYCDNKKKEFAKKISNLFIIPPCKHSDLKSIMQNSDFLFFSTKVGVGYGQVTLEALACGMELLILNPVGDCLSLYSSIYYRSIAEIISRLMEEYPPRNFNFPSTMLEENLKKQYLQYFAGKLE